MLVPAWRHCRPIFSRSFSLAASTIQKMPKFLSAAEAKALDEELMGPVIGYKAEQLMELAGQSVANAVYQRTPRVLVVCGPGNNGGDGLVAARHLVHFGYQSTIVYPRKRPVRDLFEGLMNAATAHGIPIVEDLPADVDGSCDLVLDAIFGFSFAGAIRAPFDSIITRLKACSRPIIAVDVPSGWDVDDGNVEGKGLDAVMLISLTAPKHCARHFAGEHWIGGRFVPEEMNRRHQLDLPAYPGLETVVRCQTSKF